MAIAPLTLRSILEEALAREIDISAAVELVLDENDETLIRDLLWSEAPRLLRLFARIEIVHQEPGRNTFPSIQNARNRVRVFDPATSRPASMVPRLGAAGEDFWVTRRWIVGKGYVAVEDMTVEDGRTLGGTYIANAAANFRRGRWWQEAADLLDEVGFATFGEGRHLFDEIPEDVATDEGVVDGG